MARPAVRILGIDPGTATTGFGVLDCRDGRYTLIDAGVISTPSTDLMHDRLADIYANVTEIIADHQPQVLSIEKLFFAQNVTTAMSVSQSRGVVLLAAAQAKLLVHEYTPLQIKQTITGYGKADKKQMQEMVRVLLALTEIPKPDDCADALAAAITHAMHSGA